MCAIYTSKPECVSWHLSVSYLIFWNSFAFTYALWNWMSFNRIGSSSPAGSPNFWHTCLGCCCGCSDGNTSLAGHWNLLLVVQRLSHPFK